MLKVVDFPQVFIVSSSGIANKIDLKLTKESMAEFIEIASKPSRELSTSIDLIDRKSSRFGIRQRFAGFIQDLLNLRLKLKHLLLNDYLLGGLMLLMNLLFLSASWRFSGWIVTVIFNLISENSFDKSGDLSLSKKSN